MIQFLADQAQQDTWPQVIELFGLLTFCGFIWWVIHR